MISCKYNCHCFSLSLDLIDNITSPDLVCKFQLNAVKFTCYYDDLSRYISTHLFTS